jgi:hypothetical protein
MLWYKSWLDTRWRFLIGLGVLLVAACGIVFQYPALKNILPTIGAANVPDGPLTRAIEEAVQVARTYRGFVWRQWFDQNFSYLGTFFAALLGSGSPFSGSGRGVLFTLALPVPRSRWLGARAATGLAQLFAFAMIPSVAIALLSPLIGEHFGVGDAVAHAACVFVVSSVFFSLALLLSTVFGDLWRPFLLTCLAAVGLSLGELALPDGYGFFAAMAAESYFRGGALPWTGLSISAALTAALLYAAAANVARRDF